MRRHPLRITSAALCLLIGLLASSTAGQGLDGRAGVCYSFYPGAGNRPYLPLVKQAGSRWDRFDFSWPSIEPTEGTWHFGEHDTLVHDLGEYDIETIGILLWTPDWAATAGHRGQPLVRSSERPGRWSAASLLASDALSTLSTSPPRGLYERWDDPGNYWGRYVYRVVSRYSDPARFRYPVKHWEMWNEVDDGIYNSFWTGSAEDYARLLEVGYLATKHACPDCTVLYAGLWYWADPGHFERVLAILNEKPGAATHNAYFDVMSVHLYSRSSTVYDTIEHIRSRMTEYVAERPIWLTETGVMVWNDPSLNPNPTKYELTATEEEAAAYVIQSYANGWASGVEQYMFFRANDEDMPGYGLMRNDLSFRPSYAAYQVATRYLVDPTMVTHWSYTSGVRRVTLWGTPHGKISVLWNETPQEREFEYPAALPTATLVDQRGATQAVSAAEEGYRITLPGATANLVSDPNDYIIGGEPYLIIEADTVSPGEPTVTPLPATTYSNTIKVSWSASDGEAGIWGVEIDVREGESGSWSRWLELGDTTGTSSAGYGAGRHDTVYCFRARAWDRAGNVGPWSTESRCTLLDMDQDVSVSVGPVFGDGNGDGTWDEDTEEGLDNLTFRLIDRATSEPIATGSGTSWSVEQTLRIGAYEIWIGPDGWPSSPPGWLPRRLSLVVGGGASPLAKDYGPRGLLPHRSSSYLPILAREG